MTRLILPSLAAFALVHEWTLQLVGEITAGQSRAHVCQAGRAADGIAPAHQSHAPFFSTRVPIVSERSSRARVFCFPRDGSCSQCKTIPT